MSRAEGATAGGEPSPGVSDITLALSCSAQGLSVALARPRTGYRPTLECWFETDVTGRSDALLAAVDGLLRSNGVAPAQLGCICVDVGPGPFTALRMACSIAQGISLAVGAVCVEVGSTEALAVQAVTGRGPGQYRVMVAIDARMGELYGATVDVELGAGGVLERVAESRPCVVNAPAQIWSLAGPGQAPAGGALLLMAGNARSAVPGVADLLDGEAADCGWRVDSPAGAVALRADAIARVGLLGGRRVSPAGASPRYVRNKVALDVDEQAAARNRAPGGAV